MRLEPFVGKGDLWVTQPFSVVTSDGVVWSVATDRSWLVAVQGGAPYPRGTVPSRPLFTILGLLQKSSEEPVSVALQDLRTFAGDYVDKPWSEADPSGYVLGVPVSLSRLAYLLKELPGENAQAWKLLLESHEPCLVLDILGECKVFLMGLGGVPPGVPTFTVGPDSEEDFDPAFFLRPSKS